MKLFTTPIVLFCYNRPDKTRQVLEAILEIRPSRLYVISDGAKNNLDKNKVDKTLQVVKKLCHTIPVVYDISKINLGCSERIISGINLVFEKEDRAVFLEDDCLPDLSFFPYCEELLLKYEFQDEIMHISGYNIMGETETEASYFFSKFAIPPWGWATWKRAWINFNSNLDTWQKIKTEAWKNISQEYFKDWTDMFENIRINRTTWDVPWNVDIWKKKGRVIIPQKNLVQNIGLNKTATFTKGNNSGLINTLHYCEFPLIHPDKMESPFEQVIEEKIIHSIRSYIS